MKQRLCHLLHRVGTLVYLFVGGVLSAIDNSKQSRRCLGPTLSNSIDVARRERLGLLHRNTTCEKCPLTRLLPKYERRNNDSYHVMMFLTDDHHEFTSLAAGLLETERFEVTILHFHEETTKSSLHDYIFSRIPCQHEAWVKDSLTVMDIAIPLRGPELETTSSVVDDDCRATAPHPFDPCTIQAAPKTIKIVQNYMLLKDQATGEAIGTRPDVLVMDATLVGGLLFSELWRIPTVAIASHQALDLAIEHDPDWTPNPEWHVLYRLYRIIRQRLYSLSLTGPFLEVNRLRRELRLRPLKSPMDYFLPLVALIVEFSPSDMIPSTNQYHWQKRVHITGSLQAPCTPCLHLTTSSSSSKSLPRKLNSTIVMVAPPPNCTAEWTRSLIRGLTLARSSLENYDECEWDSLSCRNEAADFTILWLELKDNIEYFPEFVPPYIIREPSASLLDSLSRHPNTIAAVVHCDSDSHVLSSILGLSVLCVSQSERLPAQTVNHLLDGKKLDPREIAVQLLGLMRRRNVQQDNADEKNEGIRLDGLSRAVSILGRVAATHREQRPWEDVLQMQRVVSQAISNDLNMTRATTEQSIFDEQQPYDTFTVLVAWFVILSSGLYVLLKDSLLARWRPRRTHHHHHNRGDSLSEGILTRLPDLDDAWATLVQWYKEQPVLMRTESLVASTTTEESHHKTPSQGINHASNHGHHHQGNLRRRRKR